MQPAARPADSDAAALASISAIAVCITVRNAQTETAPNGMNGMVRWGGGPPTGTVGGGWGWDELLTVDYSP